MGQIRRAVSRLLGRQKRRDVRAHYAHEIDLFCHVYTPRPWVNCEDVSRIEVTKDDVDVLEYDLRRWEHAIDKGLQLPECRIGFGRDKIRCMIRMMTLLRRFPGRCRTVANSVAILRRYQQKLESDIAGASTGGAEHASLEQWAAELSTALAEFGDLDCSEVVEPSYPELSPTYFRRRSVRRWIARPVEQEKLRLLVEAAVWSPSSCNRQPHKFLFVRDPARKTQLVSAATGGSGFAERAPVICVLLNDVRAYTSPCERHLAYIDTSLAAANLVLAAHELGLGTVWLNWALPDVRVENPLRKTLRIPPWYAIIALVALGYPEESGSLPPPIRRCVDDMIAFDAL